MPEHNEVNSTSTGDSNPNTGRNAAWIIVLIFILFAPVAILTALAIYALFSFARISHKVLAGFVFLYAAILLVIGQIPDVFINYKDALIDFAFALPDGQIGELLFSAFIHQAPASLLVGGFIGVFVSWWRYIRRPAWMETNFRRTPFQLFKRWKNIRNIQNDKVIPPSGRTIGVSDVGERIVQTEAESAAHTLLTGGAGTGKTTTLLVGARDLIERGESLVFVDMKGSDDVPRVLAEYAERYGRPFYHWTSHIPRTTYTGPSKNGPAFYDPLGRGDSTRKTNLLMAGRDWSEDYYRITIQNYLQMAFEIADGAPLDDKKIDSLQEATQLLDPQTLKKRTLKLVGNPDYDNIITEINHLTDRKLDPKTVSTLDSMRAQLGILRNSIQGQWLRRDPEGKRDINLLDVAHKNAVVVFTVDSSNYEENAKIVGDLIIQDLKTVSSDLRENPSRYPLNIFIDEFSAIGSDNIVTLAARCRDAKMPVTLSTQSLGDLKVVSPSFMEQLTGIISAFIIHRANSLTDAEVFAGLGGKEMKFVHRESVQMRSGFFGGMGVGSGTGQGSVDKVLDYKISPTDIQELEQGELFYISKTTSRIERVDVIKESDMLVSTKNDHSTKQEDTSWSPEAEDYVFSMDKETQEQYTVDPTINNPKPREDSLENSKNESKKPNQEALKRIFNKENVEKDTNEDSVIEKHVPKPKTTQKDSTPEEEIEDTKPFLGRIQSSPSSIPEEKEEPSRMPEGSSNAPQRREVRPLPSSPTASKPSRPKRDIAAPPPAQLPPRPKKSEVAPQKTVTPPFTKKENDGKEEKKAVIEEWD